MQARPNPRPWFGWLGALAPLVTIAVIIFVALPEAPASASHYEYEPCGIGEGFVHGSSTGDGSFFSVVREGVCNPLQYDNGGKRCQVNLYGSIISQSAAFGGSECNAWSGGSGRECAGSADVDWDYVFSSHRHYAHNRCI